MCSTYPASLLSTLFYFRSLSIQIASDAKLMASHVPLSNEQSMQVASVSSASLGLLPVPEVLVSSLAQDTATADESFDVHLKIGADCTGQAAVVRMASNAGHVEDAIADPGRVIPVIQHGSAVEPTASGRCGGDPARGDDSGAGVTAGGGDTGAGAYTVAGLPRVQAGVPAARKRSPFTSVAFSITPQGRDVQFAANKMP